MTALSGGSCVYSSTALCLACCTGPDQELLSMDMNRQQLGGGAHLAQIQLMNLKQLKLLICSVALGTCMAPFSAHAEDGPDWLDDGGKSLPHGVVSNDNVTVSNDSTPFQLTVEAERALKSNKPDRAIALIKKSLELDNEDLEAHLIYANALERKLSNQTDEDPQVFNRCVREWLIVLRNEFGEEKGETFHGIGLPGLSGKWYSDDRQERARTHLTKLTGVAPKLWETNERYLAKVCRSGETSVRAKLLNEKTKPANTGTTSGAKTSERPDAGTQ